MSCEIMELEAAHTLICAASSSFWWVTPVIIAISAFAGGFLTWKSISSAREMARKRATIDFVERSESNEYYQSLYSAFTEVRKDDAGFEQLIDVTNPQVLEQRQKVINYLNHYELMALGIARGMFDEDVYKDFMRSTLVRDWFSVKGFVSHLRTPTSDSGSEVTAKKAFCCFEELAEKWAPEVQRDLPLK